MTNTPGPYLHISFARGREAPYYALRFDRQGLAASPLTQQHLLHTLAAGGTTDVYLFSHGWNNDWKTAHDAYRRFIVTYRDVRERHGKGQDEDYRPVLVGVHWPSTALLMAWEQGPELAGAGGTDIDAVDLSLAGELASYVDPRRLARYYELVERPALEEGEARELLKLMTAVYESGDPDVPRDPGRDLDEMLAAWAVVEAQVMAPALPSSAEDFGAAGTFGTTAPDVAGLMDMLNPRDLIRSLTVFHMKDRAGMVGAAGVGPLLRDMIQATDGMPTRYHLVGHSYGARVLLAAITHPRGGPLPHPIDSLLLLQPAVNHLCFADRLPNGHPGGFHQAPDLVRQPILTTYTPNDFALHKLFHLALRRGKDLGEIEIAGDEPPNEYAALGGYGPRGFDDWGTVAIKDPPEPYDLGAGAPGVWAVNGSRTITGHGDVVNESTAWALCDLAGR
ncbi:hypothetical protein ABZW11_11095 [Nonomuraea sp. NPDC004580]|uniref:hypothetical protein n=1 Tax=Nonomuraea sp. NPDC004580 TaxID=3154552 RepID=UPI0033B13236